MQITYLDGRRYSRAVTAASWWLAGKQRRLNDINVYPVPDGDTGTNMAATMLHISEMLAGVSHHSSIEIIGDKIAESALNGARGNSGAILAQFFSGLAEGFKGKSRITTRHFSQAVQHAIERSYEALAQPKEGTILTVIKDWGSFVKGLAKKTHDFSELMHASMRTARSSLDDTPKKLNVLAQAGVVDAGAQGFIYMLEGVLNFIRNGRVDLLDINLIAGDSGSDHARVSYSKEDITFRYCTEFYLTGRQIPTTKIREELREHGDSLIVAGIEDRVKIHLHTDEPRTVFDLVSRFGEIADQKVDDMFQQHFDVHEKHHVDSIAVVTDSSCDLPEEIIRKYNIHMIPLRLYLDGSEYLDKITIHADEFYQRLTDARDFPRTSQPAPGDFVRTYQHLARNYQSIISIHVSSALSGTYQAAVSASSQVSDIRIFVIDAKTTTVALGLIVHSVADAISEGETLEGLLPRIDQMINSARLFVSLDTIEYLIRGGRLGRGKALLANALSVRPLLAINQHGGVEKIASAKQGIPIQRKLLDQVNNHAKTLESPRFAIAHVESPVTAQWYKDQLRAIFANSNILTTAASPVLGAHAGPGAAAVAVIDQSFGNN